MQWKIFLLLLVYLAANKQPVNSAKRRPQKDEYNDDNYYLNYESSLSVENPVYASTQTPSETRSSTRRTVSTPVASGNVFPGNGPILTPLATPQFSMSPSGATAGGAASNDFTINTSNLCYTNVISSPVQATQVHEKFNAKLLQLIAPANQQKNMVYSPISLQTLLAYVYMGADEHTAEELYRALEIPQDKSQVAYIFEKLSAALSSSAAASSSTAPQLIMTNKLYHNYNLAICSNNNFAKYFLAAAEAVDFSSPNTALLINSRISKATQNHINNLIDPASLEPQTLAILVNVIYFKAKWAKVFSTSNTQVENFRVNKEYAVPVKMMYIEDDFRYEDFPDLQAQVLELRYQDSDLSMLLLLPHDINGLSQLEQRLSNANLQSLTAKLQFQKVTLRLPKFQIEYELDMVAPLQELQIRQLFSNNAKLPGFFRNNQHVGISKVQHKAFIDVNEAGSEAAAASFSKIIPLSIPPKQIIFTADHPFIFLIRDANAVYFVGHVVSP